MTQHKPPVDFAGYLDTLERRADYLSRIVHPEPGSPQRRSAHWRDEAELKAIRYAITCVRRSRDSEKLDTLVLDALTRAHEAIDADEHPFAARVVDEALVALEDYDARAVRG